MPPLKLTLVLETLDAAFRSCVPPPKPSMPAPLKLPLLAPPPLRESVPVLTLTTPLPAPLEVLLKPIWMSMLAAPDLV